MNGLALAALALAAAGGAGPVPTPFEIPATAALPEGCGGSLDAWRAAPGSGSPDRVALEARNGAATGCLLAPGLAFVDGTISGVVAWRRGAAGFVARHRDSWSRLDVTIDPAAGLARVTQWRLAGPAAIGSAFFEAPPPGRPLPVAVTLAGTRVIVTVDGARVLEAEGADRVEGAAGLLVSPGAEARFDSVEIRGQTAPSASEPAEEPLLEPADLPAAAIGAPYDLGLRVAGWAGAGAPWRLTGSAAPRGLALNRPGRLAGRADDAPGTALLTMTAAGPDGAPFLIVARLAVTGVTWPRFPFDPWVKSEPALALLYVTDGAGPTTTFARLGYPGRLLFRLHRDHPLLKVVMTATPANRYSGGITLADAPEAAATWRSLALEPRFDWIELASQGYTQSPPDDVNLAHHEFSTRQSGCNVDHAALGGLDYCRGRLRLAREAFRAAGIPDDRVRLLRFPGGEDSPMALLAADEAGFVAILGGRRPDRPGDDLWIAHPGGGEILEIETTSLSRLLGRSTALVEGIRTGRTAPDGIAASPEMAEATERGLAAAAASAATGGILALLDPWSETFEVVAGVKPRYLVLDSVLRAVEERYAGRIWFPPGRDLALWLDARRHAAVRWRSARGAVEAEVEPPARWTRIAAGGIESAALVIHLPARFGRVRRVLIEEAGGGPPRPIDPSRWWRRDDGVAVLFPLRGPARIRVE